jgi:hypothetical protein
MNVRHDDRQTIQQYDDVSRFYKSRRSQALDRYVTRSYATTTLIAYKTGRFSRLTTDRQSDCQLNDPTRHDTTATPLHSAAVRRSILVVDEAMQARRQVSLAVA